MFRILMWIAIILTAQLVSMTNVAADPVDNYKAHQLEHSDVFTTTKNQLLPSQIVQLNDDNWHQPSRDLFQLNWSTLKKPTNQQWLKLPLRNSTNGISSFNLIDQQPILKAIEVYTADQYNYLAITPQKTANLAGETIYTIAVNANSTQDVFIKIPSGINLPQLAIIKRTNFTNYNQYTSNNHWAYLGTAGILLLLILLMLPFKLINPFSLVFSLLLLGLWQNSSHQLISHEFWSVTLILSALLIIAPLSRFKRSDQHQWPLKRLIVAIIAASALWFIPDTHHILTLLALPLALIIMLVDYAVTTPEQLASNRTSRLEKVSFIVITLFALLVSLSALANIAGFISQWLSYNQAIALVATSCLLSVVISNILQLKYQALLANTDLKFSHKLEHQVTTQQATISQLKSTLKMAEDHLKIDELTGLRNKEYFETNLALEINRTRRHNFPISVLMIKIDGLAEVTKQYDYETTNQCLQQIAIRCQKQLKRSSDKVCRYHDETFAVILPDTHAQGAMQLANLLINCIAKDPIATDAAKITININIGLVTGISDTSLNSDKLTEAATSALTDAMTAGISPISQVVLEPKTANSE